MIARLLAFLRRLFPGNVEQPEPMVLASSQLVDYAFIRQSFRKGEAFDPLSATTEESI